MNVLEDPHPTLDELTQFNLGKLDDARTLEVEDHVATCVTCAQVLAQLPPDSLIRQLQHYHRAQSENAPSLVPPDDAVTLPPAAEQATIPHGKAPTCLCDAAEKKRERLPPELITHPRYQILERLGEGGMGSVYKAQHRLMNRPVALKIINSQLVNHPGAIERFHREVQAAARLAHPNIVAAHDAEQAGNVHFLVMEFVDGVNLHQVIQQRGPLPVAEACEYIRQAALGLQHAHERGMVHRDVKPHNLMLAEVCPADGGPKSGEPGHSQSSIRTPQSAVIKILDFGLANLASEAVGEGRYQDDAPSRAIPRQLTLSGAMMGTPDYIAPEQAVDAHAVDIRADIYSLGCTFYYLLTGQAPFQEGTVVDKIAAHAEREPAPLSTFRTDVPADVESILNRMMAKNPDARFQTPAEVAEALEHCSALTPLPEALAAPRGAPSRRPAALAVTAVACLFLLAAGIVVATDRGRLEIYSEVDDVRVVVKQDGQEVRLIDVKTGSQGNWLPTGRYELELVGGQNEVVLDKQNLVISRFGKVTAAVHYTGDQLGLIRSFSPSDQPITRDGIEPSEGGWKLTATSARTVRLFEVPDPKLKPGRFFYRAKLKTENVKGRAYLEMWVRVPGQGEFFSKGLYNALTGDNGWAECEIPFLLGPTDHPDLVKLNVTIEGGGTVWIKDIELHGRSDDNPVNGKGAARTPASLIDMHRQALLVDAITFTRSGYKATPRLFGRWLNLRGPDHLVGVYL